MKTLPLFGGWPVLTALILSFAGCSHTPAPTGNIISSRGAWLIGKNSIGPLRVGMTLPEAAAALGPDYQIRPPMERPLIFLDAYYVVSDLTGREVVRFLMAGDISRPTAPGNTIGSITATSPVVTTPEGVSPGMFISSAERILGPAAFEMEAESMGGEWVSFKSQPSYLAFATNGKAGIYHSPPLSGQLTTMEYHPMAVIESISVGIFQ